MDVASGWLDRTASVRLRCYLAYVSVLKHWWFSQSGSPLLTIHKYSDRRSRTSRLNTQKKKVLPAVVIVSLLGLIARISLNWDATNVEVFHSRESSACVKHRMLACQGFRWGNLMGEAFSFTSGLTRAVQSKPHCPRVRRSHLLECSPCVNFQDT